MRHAAALVLLALLPLAAFAEELPAGARAYLPVLADEISTRWPALPLPSALAAQVEQETCPSLKSRLCWNPRAELKTAREYGFGLGQLTVTKSFDAWSEVRGMDASLAPWRWQDRYDPRLQLRALVVKDHYNSERFKAVATQQDGLAFGFAAYNGGLGGTNNDRAICRATPGCDPGRWFGHVELTSRKSRTKWQGYGQSAFDINRTYVRNVLIARRPRYVEAMGGK